MTEQIKIMDMLHRWGYLTAEQIALLLNKNQNTIERLLDYHVSKGFYKIDQHTRKNIYYLSHKGNTFVGREHKKAIKINCYELAHQDMLIKWLCRQTDIEYYQTERELKMENGNLNAYPDLIITKNNDSEIYVEFERTQKSPSRFNKKLDKHTKWLRKGGKIYWITPTQTLATWIENQINIIGAYPSQQTYEIWNK